VSAVTINLAEETTEKLDALAKAQNSSLSKIAAKAIEEFLEKESWQRADIQAGLEDARRGDFASDEEMASVALKYSRAASGSR
jgi:predicted transcriptional regulator